MYDTLTYSHTIRKLLGCWASDFSAFLSSFCLSRCFSAFFRCPVFFFGMLKKSESVDRCNVPSELLPLRSDLFYTWKKRMKLKHFLCNNRDIKRIIFNVRHPCYKKYINITFLRIVEELQIIFKENIIYSVYI